MGSYGNNLESFVSVLTDNRTGAKKVVGILLQEQKYSFWLLERLIKQRFTGVKLEWALKCEPNPSKLYERILMGEPTLVDFVNERAFKRGIDRVIHR